MEKYPCRGSIEYIGLIGNSIIELTTETAWEDCPEVWNVVLVNYPSIKHYYNAEEPGCVYYVTNDFEGRFFPDRFIVDQPSEGTLYFQKETEVFSRIASITKLSVSNQKEMYKSIEDYNLENENNEISINEIKVIK